MFGKPISDCSLFLFLGLHYLMRTHWNTHVHTLIAAPTLCMAFILIRRWKIQHRHVVSVHTGGLCVAKMNVCSLLSHNRVYVTQNSFYSLSPRWLFTHKRTTNTHAMSMWPSHTWWTLSWRFQGLQPFNLSDRGQRSARDLSYSTKQGCKTTDRGRRPEDLWMLYFHCGVQAS